MKIERNPYFKPEEAVLYCGDAVYSRLQSHDEPEMPKGYVRVWKIQLKRKGAMRHKYVNVCKGRATLTAAGIKATRFYSYKEVDEIARQILDKGNVEYINIIETLSYDFVEEDYAP